MSKRVSGSAAKAPARPDARARAAAARARAVTGQPDQGNAPAPAGEPADYLRLPMPEGAHRGTYALAVTGDGAGRWIPPGSFVIVEPLPPSGRDFTVATVDGQCPSIWQIGESFDPEMLRLDENSTVRPMIELFAPRTGQRGYIDAGRIEKLHRVIGTYRPVEVLKAFGAGPDQLPLMSEIPDGCVEQVVEDAANYPVLRQGDIAVVDPARRDLTHGALCLFAWRKSRSISQTNFRKMGSSGPHWVIDPINRPRSRANLDRPPEGPLFASDGPYNAEDLQARMVGTVVGIRMRSRWSV